MDFDFVKALVPVCALADRGLLEHTVSVLLARVETNRLAGIIADVAMSGELDTRMKELVVRMINERNGGKVEDAVSVVLPSVATPQQQETVVADASIAMRQCVVAHSSLIPGWVTELGRLFRDLQIVRKRVDLYTAYDVDSGKWRCAVPEGRPLHNESEVYFVNGRVVMPGALATKASKCGWGVSFYLSIQNALCVLDEFLCLDSRNDDRGQALREFWQRWECEPNGGVPGAMRAYARALVKSDDAWRNDDDDCSNERNNRRYSAARVEDRRVADEDLAKQLWPKISEMSSAEVLEALGANRARQQELMNLKNELRKRPREQVVREQEDAVHEEHSFLYVQQRVLWARKNELAVLAGGPHRVGKQTSVYDLAQYREGGRTRVASKTPPPLSAEEQQVRAEAAKAERIARAEAAARKRDSPGFGAMKPSQSSSSKQQNAGKKATGGKKAARNGRGH